MTTIRPFQSGDSDRIRLLGGRLAEGVAAWRSPERVRETIADWVGSAIEKADADDHLLAVAVSSADQVVGFISVAVQKHYIDGIDAYIGELAVDTSCERQGIGQDLVAYAESWARTKGCERLTLQTGAANTGSRSFYAKLGFLEEDISLARPIE